MGFSNILSPSPEALSFALYMASSYLKSFFHPISLPQMLLNVNIHTHTPVPTSPLCHVLTPLSQLPPTEGHFLDPGIHRCSHLRQLPLPAHPWSVLPWSPLSCAHPIISSLPPTSHVVDSFLTAGCFAVTRADMIVEPCHCNLSPTRRQ